MSRVPGLHRAASRTGRPAASTSFSLRRGRGVEGVARGYSWISAIVDAVDVNISIYQ